MSVSTLPYRFRVDEDEVLGEEVVVEALGMEGAVGAVEEGVDPEALRVARVGVPLGRQHHLPGPDTHIQVVLKTHKTNNSQ